MGTSLSTSSSSSSSSTCSSTSCSIPTSPVIHKKHQQIPILQYELVVDSNGVVGNQGLSSYQFSDYCIDAASFNTSTVYSASSSSSFFEPSPLVTPSSSSEALHSIPSILISPINISNHHHNTRAIKTRPRSNTKETLTASRKRDKEGRKMINDFVIVKKLGKGTYGKVLLSYHQHTNQLYAIKVFNKIRLKKQSSGFGKPNAFDGVLREIAIMKKLNHPNVVKLFEVINDPTEECLYIVMEYIEGGAIMSCSDFSNWPMSENLARKYFRDIVSGLEYLHEQKVIHRDIKPENLLVNRDGVVKIADFGVSHIFENDDILRCSAGSPAFLAPELCTDEQIPISGKAVDIWALGISLYCLVFAKLPFETSSKSLSDIYHKIKNDPLTFPREISFELKFLFQRLLDKNPFTRITISEIKNNEWTTINNTLPMKELDDHILLSVTDQECYDAIISDHMIQGDDLSSSTESSGIVGGGSSCGSDNNNNSLMYYPVSPQQPLPTTSSGSYHL
ncbi:hypothetical protein CYY_001054 [Polysphondylium violaceum]|uniref:non-specific serine/threonine protein kinase n=1 Tax=Polysphondylium violaceum TaxID=133409 RepID=A0A8J4Q9V4_9MYCE|nr:hypothetical protein CYY_001054 [Polysphondylium violaceum]